MGRSSALALGASGQKFESFRPDTEARSLFLCGPCLYDLNLTVLKLLQRKSNEQKN